MSAGLPVALIYGQKYIFKIYWNFFEKVISIVRSVHRALDERWRKICLGKLSRNYLIIFPFKMD